MLTSSGNTLNNASLGVQIFLNIVKLRPNIDHHTHHQVHDEAVIIYPPLGGHNAEAQQLRILLQILSSSCSDWRQSHTVLLDCSIWVPSLNHCTFLASKEVTMLCHVLAHTVQLTLTTVLQGTVIATF